MISIALIIIIFEIIYGLYEIYKKKVKKEEYSNHEMFTLAFLAIIIFQDKIALKNFEFLLGLLAVIVIFILCDRMYDKIVLINRTKKEK